MPPKAAAATHTTDIAKLERKLDRTETALQSQQTATEQLVSNHKQAMSNLVNKYQTAAGYAVGGFGLAAGASYLFHDDVVEFFGKDSWLGYLTLPTLGALAMWATTKIKDPSNKPGARLDDRLGLLGLGLGFLLGGGYMSYQTWPAETPKT